MRVLVTRPEPEARRTASLLRARGHAVRVAPLLAFSALAEADIGGGPWSGLVLTSANAARAIARHAQAEAVARLPVLAVGARTAAAARGAGFADVASAGGDADDLVRLAAQRFRAAAAPLLYPAGEERARDIAAELAPHGIVVETVTVYRMLPARQFPPSVAAALASGQRIDAVLHYSRRSAATYLACADAAGLREPALRPAHYCISAEAGAPLAAAGAARLHIAPHPDEPALLDLLDGA